MSALLAGAVALACWILIAPHGRRAAALARPSRPRPRGPRRRVVARLRSSKAAEPTVRVIVAQVAALLRAGAPPGAAWRRVTGVSVDDLGVPEESELAAEVGDRSARAVVAATRLALTVGAPLAPVLGAVCTALGAQADADAERTAAIAGPRTTARVLAWLPGAGLGLGWVLGADPVATATDGGIGTATVGAGLGFLVLGRWWISRLVAHARKAGADS